MNSKNTLSISEARKKIFEIARAVQRPGIHYTLTEKGKPRIVVISAEEFESLIETVEVMQDFPHVNADTQLAYEQYTVGQYSTLETLLEQRGFVLAEKAHKKYELSSHTTKKSSKRTKRNS